MAKLRVGLLFGGRSVEHEVSIASATSILEALDRDRYDVTLIAVDKRGRWRRGAPALPPGAAVEGTPVRLPAVPGNQTVLVTEVDRPADAAAALPGAGSSSQLEARAEGSQALDVIFPVIHGSGGEDGVLQGLLEMAGVPYVGAGVLASAVQMDKDVAKRLLAAAGLPVVQDVVLRGAELEAEGLPARAEAVSRELGLPVFVKPANSGSSVGISKATDLRSLVEAVALAARYDTKVLIERAVDAREIEVAVLGNQSPQASVPGEIGVHHEFYDYEAKYLDGSTELLIPAPISPELSERVRSLALRAFSVLEGEGLARVDFLLDRHTGELYVNELNSMPGFTEHSMFPLMWAASGLPYPKLLDRMIELALERHARRSRLETDYCGGA
jgi:D-alanine-D-alanine ligase